MKTNPRDLIATIERSPVLPPGHDERFAGYGVMGLPFSSGHYLALRRFPASSVGPAYTAIWWRDPTGHWVILADAPPGQSCARYFGRAVERAEQRPIGLTWSGPRSLRLSIPDLLLWDIELGSTVATRLLSHVGAAAPRWMWRNPAALRATAVLASTLLATGKLCLHGTTPNGQWFLANPRRAWIVTASRATIAGQDAGPTGPLERQTRLGDLWLPQRGVFFVGETYLEPFDPARHWSAVREPVPSTLNLHPPGPLAASPR
jgi:hypothetical protein